MPWLPFPAHLPQDRKGESKETPGLEKEYFKELVVRGAPDFSCGVLPDPALNGAVSSIRKVYWDRSGTCQNKMIYMGVGSAVYALFRR